MREKRRAEAEAKGEVPEQQQAATIIGPADEAVRKVVVDRALSGQYEEPKFAADPVGIARSWHLRSETYTAKDLESFEKKLKSLVARTGGKSGGAPGKQRGAAARV
ncbi:hypothetical protein HIM_09106 [Hirsutella minnesotensis 3608]|uniref:Uncharacterized protein n=1 Tax=Hirsutella minnesotensis 3608 TaxID=1043627 RepID=A0A0F7ZXX2_9HYPO|nr:hypothetical protein HIM_09106 [Hirsutella minnesotensis 3608]